MRLHEEKGANLIPAFATKILSQNRDLYLIIGGGGPLESTLKKETAKFRDHIRWVGWENNAQGFLSACDFFWSLSREESFPQTLVEASAVGLPWVAPDVGDVRELIKCGASGLMFKRLDISDAARQTTELLAQLSERSAQAQKAAPTLSEKYSLQKMVARVYEVFERYK